MVLLIVVAIIVVALAVGVAFITVNHNNASNTSKTSGFAGYPTSLPSLTIQEDGSSLMYVVFLAWLKNFTHVYPNVPIDVDASGSGVGQQEVEQGLIQIGASDAFLFNDSQAEYPWILDIPLAVSAQQIEYNVPNIPLSMHLNFSGPVLAGIYNGSIAYWNDPAIIAINPAAASLLPHNLITVLHRADGSGDTFIFTSYLSKTDPWWAAHVGSGLTVNWPQLATAEGESGNSGMELAVQSTNDSIGYVGISYLESSVQIHIAYGYLENAAGNFVNISASNINSDVSQFVNQVPSNEVISMIDGPGANSYPIVNFEYALVSKNQSNANMAEDLKTFLKWCADPNNGNLPYYLNFAEFQPLPSRVYNLSLTQINEIGT
jgi:phosphate transport system substrate-binding protein